MTPKDGSTALMALMLILAGLLRAHGWETAEQPGVPENVEFSSGNAPGLFDEFAPCSLYWFFALGAAACGHLPAVLVERITELTHEPGVILLVDGHYPNGKVLKSDDPVDSRRSTRCCHLVVFNSDPLVLVPNAR